MAPCKQHRTEYMQRSPDGAKHDESYPGDQTGECILCDANYVFLDRERRWRPSHLIPVYFHHALTFQN